MLVLQKRQEHLFMVTFDDNMMQYDDGSEFSCPTTVELGCTVVEKTATNLCSNPISFLPWGR